MAPESGRTEERMFGGLAFLIDGHTAFSASGESGLGRPGGTDEPWLCRMSVGS